MLVNGINDNIAILKLNRPKQAKKVLDLGADIYLIGGGGLWI